MSDPEETAPIDPPEGASQRQRYGRRRSTSPVPVGDSFVPRLGPPAGESLMIATISDEDEPIHPRPEPEMPIDSLRFVALDCETTGQTPHRLVELGAIAFTLETRLASFETLVHSTDRINPYARRLHGINPESLGGAPPADRVLNRFVRFTSGTVLVEHSADAFDTRLIARTLGRTFDADNLDTSRLAAKLWDLRDTIGLERLCNELGVRHRRPHHALADAEATAECFVALVNLGREQLGWATLGDLLRDGQPPLREPKPESAPPAGGGRTRRRRGGRRNRGGGGGGEAQSPSGEAAPPPAI